MLPLEHSAILWPALSDNQYRKPILVFFSSGGLRPIFNSLLSYSPIWSFGSHANVHLLLSLTQWDDVQKSWLCYADSRSQAQFKVIGFTMLYILSPLKDFHQMFVSVRKCAESITQLCRLEVTVQGHGFYPLILCMLHISWTLWKILIKLWSNVSGMVHRTH